MALTNADRQRLHRERLKAKLASVAAPAAPDLLQRLVTAYRDAGVGMLSRHDDMACAREACAEFAAVRVTEETLIAALVKAGQGAAVRIFERKAHEAGAEQRQRDAVRAEAIFLKHGDAARDYAQRHGTIGLFREYDPHGPHEGLTRSARGRRA